MYGQQTVIPDPRFRRGRLAADTSPKGAIDARTRVVHVRPSTVIPHSMRE